MKLKKIWITEGGGEVIPKWYRLVVQFVNDKEEQVRFGVVIESGDLPATVANKLTALAIQAHDVNKIGRMGLMIQFVDGKLGDDF